MPVDDQRFDQLNAAIDDLLAGRGIEEAGADLPRSLRALLPLAARIAGTRRLNSGPRPTFVLALEEQMRADFRLAGAGAPRRARPPRVALVPVVVVALLLTAGVIGHRAWPGDTWHGLREAWAETSIALAQPGASRGMRLLDLAWARLEALAAESPDGRVGASARTRGLIDAAVGSYRRAVDELATEPDERFAARTATDLHAARDVMAGLAAAADGGPRAPWLEAAVADLDKLLALTARLAPGLVAAAPGAVPRWSLPADGRTSTDTPGSPPPPVTGTRPAPTATPGSIGGPGPDRPTDTAVLPTAVPPTLATSTATALPPTAPPAAQLPLPTSAPATEEPPERPLPRTPTPQPSVPAAPDETRVPAVNTPIGARPTATLDTWPRTSTPLPPRDITPIPPDPLPGAPPSPSPGAPPAPSSSAPPDPRG